MSLTTIDCNPGDNMILYHANRIEGKVCSSEIGLQLSNSLRTCPFIVCTLCSYPPSLSPSLSLSLYLCVCVCVRVCVNSDCR